MSGLSFGQSADRVAAVGPETAAGEIEQLRSEKQRNLRPERLPQLHRTVLWVRRNRIPEKITYGYKGFRPRFGTLGPGSGFGLGIEYFRPNLADEQFTVRTSVSGSLQSFFMVDGEFEARRIAGKGFVNALGFHRFSPSIDFYGTGAASSEDNRTAYALEENSAQVTAGWQFLPRLRAGGVGRYLTTNVVATPNPNRRTVESVFPRALVPGLGSEAPYFETGAFVELSQDPAPGARPGGSRALARWSRFFSQGAGLASFARIEGIAERTQMFTNEQRAIVLRAHTVLTVPEGTRAVPFYLQPQLGGYDELRGFAARRFYDQNLLAGTAEYQWQIFSGIWLAVFADTGKVFAQWDKWSGSGFERSYGFGARFGAAGPAAGRFDLAFSREGAQFWVVFANF